MSTDSQYESTHTIAALATASAPAGVAIVRVSGPKAKSAAKALFHSKQDPVSHPRTLCYGKVLNHKNGSTIDHGLCVFMPGPRSFTGEDTVEFHTHGSPLIAKRVLHSLFAFGITPAEPGEFTKRAFMNGKLDLIQAEAIGELITATSEASLRVASDNLAGKLSTFIDKVAEPLRDTLAEIEASLDFPEEDIEPAKHTALKNRILEAQSSLSNLLPTFQFGLRMREGFKVLLCGPPNAGKSSLLNALLGRDRAIVTEISGTTRDLIEEECIIGNHRFVLCDSAGITETHDVVERLGVELSLERIHWADLVLLIIDGAEEYSNIDELTKLIGEKTSNVWMVTNKVDLNPKSIGKYFCDGSICHQNFYLSVKTGDGLQGLKQALIEEVDNSKSDASHSSVILTQTRQAHLVESALHALGEALSHLESQTPLEIVSEDLRVALHTLEEMVGKTYTDDILGRIFSKFCIGK